LKLRGFTILVENHRGRDIRRSRLSATLLTVVGSLVLVALAGIVVFAFLYLARLSEHGELLRLTYMDVRQRESLNQGQDQLRSMVGEATDLENVNDTVRLVRGFPPGLDDEVGIGGPELGQALTEGDRLKVEILQARAVLDRQVIQFDELVRLTRGQEDMLVHFPSVNPVPNGRNVSGFGYRRDPINFGIEFHNGVDLVAPYGSPIVAAADGVVVVARFAGAYGLLVRVDHGYGFQTRYGHCSSAFVQPGDVVHRGEVIATVGCTGRATGNHCHYEVLRDGVNVDPALYIMGDQDPIRRRLLPVFPVTTEVVEQTEIPLAPHELVEGDRLLNPELDDPISFEPLLPKPEPLSSK
jgi:murein DD-endopeptidase MepM/ murein hydrolase activator NlpD